jgi:VanZ family protein
VKGTTPPRLVPRLGTPPDSGGELGPENSPPESGGVVPFYAYWLPLLAWLAFIYLFSTDDFSSGQTAGILEPILKFLFPSLSPDQIELGHAAIRKLGHISEYFILAVLTYRVMALENDGLLNTTGRTFAFVVLIAVTDEFHQSLTMQRGASIGDVGYDSFGGSLAMWFTVKLRK